MGMSASAQSETYAVAVGFTPTDNQVVDATTSVKLTYGADGAWKASAANATLSLFTASVAGGNNPKGDGASYSDADGKRVVPNTGTYYILAPSQAGTMKVGMKLNATKSFYVVQGSDGANLDSSVTLGDDANTVYTLGNNVDSKSVSQPFSLAEAATCYCTFKVTKGETYYVFCTGSKLTFFGFVFTPDGSASGINAVSSESNVNAPIFNLAGQRVAKADKGIFIQGGKKFFVK